MSRSIIPESNDLVERIRNGTYHGRAKSSQIKRTRNCFVPCDVLGETWPGSSGYGISRDIHVQQAALVINGIGITANRIIIVIWRCIGERSDVRRCKGSWAGPRYDHPVWRPVIRRAETVCYRVASAVSRVGFGN